MCVHEMTDTHEEEREGGGMLHVLSGQHAAAVLYSPSYLCGNGPGNRRGNATGNRRGNGQIKKIYIKGAPACPRENSPNLNLEYPACSA